MNYLRTQEDIIHFCKENAFEKISISTLSHFIETNLGFVFLGYFLSVLDDSFWTYSKRGGHKTQDNKFAASTKTLDFILNSRIFSDANGTNKGTDTLKNLYSDKSVELFGKMEGGKITDLFALNTGNYFNTAFADRKNTLSEDLWF
ncbi:hypothetical protein [Pedobacter sp. WC2423]|uniref:hypothetical protein n=1 Tax=Pedobacter sp. WC2423 TaxID=3234142 RepID=UPI003466D890